MDLNNTRKAKKDILFFNRVPKVCSRDCLDKYYHFNAFPGGKPNDNGAVEIPFNKEQIPLPQGTITITTITVTTITITTITTRTGLRRWRQSSSQWARRYVTISKLTVFPMGPFCRSGYQIFLISLTRRRFMSSTSVLSTSHSEWKKLPPLAFLAATVPSFCFLDRRKNATFTFLVVYLLSFFHWLSVGKLLYLGKTLSLSENFAQSNCIWSTNLLPWLSKAFTLLNWFKLPQPLQN